MGQDLVTLMLNDGIGGKKTDQMNEAEELPPVLLEKRGTSQEPGTASKV